MRVLGAVIFLIALLPSCSFSYFVKNTDQKIKLISIGMKREEVTEVMGKRYIINSFSLDSAGNSIRVLAYKSSPQSEYRLRFFNDTLQSWNRVIFNEYNVSRQITDD